MSELTENELPGWIAAAAKKVTHDPETATDILDEISGRAAPGPGAVLTAVRFELGLFLTDVCWTILDTDRLRVIAEPMLANLELSVAEPFLPRLLALSSHLNRLNHKLADAKVDALHSVALSERRRDRLSLAYGMWAFGALLHDMEDRAAAIDHRSGALKDFEAAGEYIHHAHLHIRNAIDYRGLGDYEVALAAERVGIELAVMQGRWGMAALGLSGAIEDLVALDRLDEAEQELDTARNYLPRTRGLRTLVDDELHYSAASILSARGRHSEAVALVAQAVGRIPEGLKQKRARRLVQLAAMQLAAGDGCFCFHSVPPW